MEIVAAQLNPLVGDLPGNTRAMLDVIKLHKDADLIVFPELAVSGYWPGDLLERPGFIEQQNNCIAELGAASRDGPTLLFGHAEFINEQTGDLANALSVWEGGERIFRYWKQLLPTYNIFDEARNFVPGSPDQTMSFLLGGLRIGVLLCEDAWADAKAPVRPIEKLTDEVPDLVIHINASPASIDRYFERRRLVDQHTQNLGVPWLYLNQVGGNDEVVFDGASFALNPGSESAELAVQLPAYVTAIDRLNFQSDKGFVERNASPPVCQGDASAQSFAQIVLGLRDYLSKSGFRSVVVGSSGGIDSALTLALAVEALGAESVAAITMPSRHSSAGSINDSLALFDQLKLRRTFHVDIDTQYTLAMEQFENSFGEAPDTLTRENMQARIRGRILMEYSNQFGALVLTTGNKSETAVGYCTLYGDMSGGLNPLGDLSKTEVYTLARYINEQHGRETIPTGILEKAPSAELSDGQRDSDSLPDYEVLDAVVALYVESHLLSPEERSMAHRTLAAVDEQSITRVLRMIDRAEYKRRQAAPIIRVHQRAFGVGRRLPIVQGHVPGLSSLGPSSSGLSSLDRAP